MQSAQTNLRDFHDKFGLTINETPTIPGDDVLQFRINLINEEAEEFEQAAKARNLVEMADALADLLYVTLGAAVSLGIDMAPVFEEVHRSNMTKVWPDGQVRRRADGKVIKPPTYSPANIARELQRQAKKEARKPHKGDLALCSLGALGLITADEPQEVSYSDGNKDLAYVGIHLTDKIAPIGSPWSSRSPRIAGNLSQFQSSAAPVAARPKGQDVISSQ